MANEATDIKFILRDPIRLKQILDESAQSAEKLDRATSSAGRSADRAIGPYTRLQRNVEKLVAGTAPGNNTTGNELLDLVYNARQSQSKVNKLEAGKPGFLQKSLSHISRVPMDASSGANMALSAIGAAGPEGAAIALLGNAAIEATKKVIEFANSAAASGKDLTDLRVSVGGSNADASRLLGMGAGAGDVGSARNRALSDPYAYAAAQGAGVSFMPGPMGEATAGKDFIKLLEGIRKQGEAQQRISLRTLGLEGFGGLMKVSDRTFEQMRKDSELNAKIFDNGTQVKAAEYDAAIKRLDGAVDRAKGSLGKPAMDDITNIRDISSDALDFASRTGADYPSLPRAIGRGLQNILPGMPFGAISDAAQTYQDSKRAGENKNPEEKMATAADKLAQAVSRLSQGNAGNGDGFDNAIPGALKSGQYLAIASAHGELAAMSLH